MIEIISSLEQWEDGGLAIVRAIDRMKRGAIGQILPVQ